MLKEIMYAFRSFKNAHKFIQTNKLFLWLIIPGTIYALLLSIFLFYFVNFYNKITLWIFDLVHLSSMFEHSDDSSWKFLFIIGKVFFDIFLLVACLSIYKSIFLLFTSPLYSYLIKKTACIGNDALQQNTTSLFQISLLGARLVLKSTFWLLIYIICCLPIALIPVLGWVMPLVVFVIDATAVGRMMVELTLLINAIPDSKLKNDEQKGLAVGNGLMFYALHGIPFIGWIFAPGYTAVAASLSVVNLRNLK